MYTPSLLVVLATSTILSHVGALRVQDRRPDQASSVAQRSADDDFDYDEDSVCLSYGIDFQNGGSYFIDSRSTDKFTVVSQFAQCEPDTSAYILLVNNDSGDQWECTGVPTPDSTNEVSVCPITKSEMSSGSWSVLVIGNNGDGSPFAWQRDFTLTVGIPTTSTTTSTVTFTDTTTPVTTVATTSTYEATTSVPNKQTITVPAATRTVTITPKAITTTSTKWLTRTIHRWSHTQSKVTATITATCTVPRRPSQHDPRARIVPTIIPLPKGLTISDFKRKSFHAKPQETKPFKPSKNNGRHMNRVARAAELNKRAPDASTIYVQAGIVVNATVTATAPISTFTSIQLTTITATITAPPGTVKSGTATVSTTLPPQTKTITRIGYTTVTRTKTIGITWTYTTTIAPTASVSACTRRGGHLDL